jgi:hypothetical protein
MLNWMFGLPAEITCEQSPLCQRQLWACSWLCSTTVTRLFRSALNRACCWNTNVQLTISSPNSCLIIICLRHKSSKFWTKLMHTRCRTHREIPSLPEMRFEIKGHKKQHITQLRETGYTASQDMLVLSSAVEVCYYNSCTVGSTSYGKYGYHVVLFFFGST